MNTLATGKIMEECEQFVASLKSSMKLRYDRAINKDLARQNWQDLFGRNVSGVSKQLYSDALTHLRQSIVYPETTAVKVDGSSVKKDILKAFDGLFDELIQYALQKHRTSCAISNFPSEHKPAEEYIAEVVLENAKQWNSFTEQVKHILSKQNEG